MNLLGKAFLLFLVSSERRSYILCAECKHIVVSPPLPVFIRLSKIQPKSKRQQPRTTMMTSSLLSPLTVYPSTNVPTMDMMPPTLMASITNKLPSNAVEAETETEAAVAFMPCSVVECINTVRRRRLQYNSRYPQNPLISLQIPLVHRQST